MIFFHHANIFHSITLKKFTFDTYTALITEGLWTSLGWVNHCIEMCLFHTVPIASGWQMEAVVLGNIYQPQSSRSSLAFVYRCDDFTDWTVFTAWILLKI